MTEKELKKYAVVGLLVRIEAEQKRLQRIKREEEKKIVQSKIETLVEHYMELLNEIRE